MSERPFSPGGLIPAPGGDLVSVRLAPGDSVLRPGLIADRGIPWIPDDGGDDDQS